jgi:hypothetical protein
MRMLLEVYKLEYPDIFCTYARISPACFDHLLAAISDDAIFQNECSNEQAPVDQQLAIALYRFGHFGNAASTKKVALHFGVGYGTVYLYTKCVMIAVCSGEMHASTCHQRRGRSGHGNGLQTSLNVRHDMESGAWWMEHLFHSLHARLGLATCFLIASQIIHSMFRQACTHIINTQLDN